MIIFNFEAMPKTFGMGIQHIVSNNQEKGSNKSLKNQLRPKKKINLFKKKRKKLNFITKISSEK